MSTPTVRADYDALAQVAGQFGQQTEAAQQSLQQVRQAMEVLQNGDWVGPGAAQFYAEMNGTVLPTLNRLVNALDNGARTTKTVSQVMKAAEDEAARWLTVQAGTATLAASPGGGSAPPGGIGGLAGALGAAAGAAAGGAGGAAGVAAAAAAGAAARAAAAASKTSDTAAVLKGTTKLADAPATILLPTKVDKGMQDAWKDSFPGGHELEQGGLIVQNKDGSLDWVRGGPGTGGTWTPNYGDLGADQTYLGLGHTHPYDSGAVDVPFSDADISFLFETNSGHQAQTMVVQSGRTQFALGRTEEFNTAMAGKTQAEIATTVAEMTTLYNDTVAAQKAAGASFADRYQAAVKAVADKYKLTYYKGSSGSLIKQ
jgi:WXG100 family type VII secretion target